MASSSLSTLGDLADTLRLYGVCNACHSSRQLDLVRLVSELALFGSNQMFVTVVPLIVMLVYFFHAKDGIAQSSRPERAGDNVYYLGFLYTLVSLALALYHFKTTNSEHDSLIADFAIALATTIAGVLGRVWLSQGKIEVEDFEATARIHLRDAVEEFHTQLSASRESMRIFAVETGEVLTKNRGDLEEHLRESSQAHNNRLTSDINRFSKDMADTIESAMSMFSESLRSSADGVGQDSERLAAHISELAKTSKKLGVAMERAANTIDQIPPPGEEIKRKIEALSAPITAVTDIIEKLVASQSGWAAKLDASFSAATKTGERVQFVLDSVVRGTVAMEKSIADAGGSLQSTLAGIDGEAKNMEGVIQAAIESIRSVMSVPVEVQAAHKEFARQLGGLSGIAVEVSESLIPLSKSLVSRSGAVETALKREEEAFQQIGEHRDNVISSFQNVDRDLGNSLASLRTRIDELSVALISIAQFITNNTKQPSQG